MQDGALNEIKHNKGIQYTCLKSVFRESNQV